MPFRVVLLGLKSGEDMVLQMPCCHPAIDSEFNRLAETPCFNFRLDVAQAGLMCVCVRCIRTLLPQMRQTARFWIQFTRESLMKRALSVAILVLTASVAFALPSPKDISTAVNSGQLTQAEGMLHEVIQEKPASAKARYELGQVLAREGRRIEANQELLEAQRLDPSLKFASTPQAFHSLIAKTSGTLTPIAPALVPAAQTAMLSPDIPWIYIVLGGGVLLIAVWLLRRSVASAPVSMVPAGAALGTGAMAGGGMGYGQANYNPAQAPASGMGGAVMGGIAGLAAGYGLSKLLEGSSESHAHSTATGGNSFTPVDSSPQADYGSFDAGTGDSWDSGDTSSGNDNW
jgi:hypothetical protein